MSTYATKNGYILHDVDGLKFDGIDRIVSAVKLRELFLKDAALTAPETAEAVEAAETRVMEFLVSRFGGHSVTVVRNGVGRLIGYSLGDDEHDAIAIRDLLDAAGPLHQPSVSDPAPATDDRERLVEALREARQWVEANTAQVRGLSLEAAAPGEAMLRKIDAALTKEASR